MKTKYSGYEQKVLRLQPVLHPKTLPLEQTKDLKQDVPSSIQSKLVKEKVHVGGWGRVIVSFSHS